MKSAIRMAVVVMMAGTSTAALATQGDARGYDLESERAIGEVTETKFETATTNTDANQDIGHGSGEPGRSETMTNADDPAAKKAAIAAYNQRNFLNQTWSSSP